MNPKINWITLKTSPKPIVANFNPIKILNNIEIITLSFVGLKFILFNVLFI